MVSSTKIPRVVSILGKAIELKMYLNNGDEMIYLWPGRKTKKSGAYYLASNPAGNALYILPATHSKKNIDKSIHPSEMKRAAKLYENFTDFEFDKPFALCVPDKPFKRCGRATHIVYRSDKWSGKDQDYIHEFDNAPIVHASGSAKNPKMIALTGGRIRVQPRGIVG